MYSKATISEALQEGILSSLLYSVASIQYAHDKTPLGNRNHFLMTVTSVLGAIGYSYPEVSASIFHLITGLEHYMEPVKKRGDTKLLDDLLTEMFEVAQKNKPDDTVTTVGCYDTEDGGDEVDGPVVPPNTTTNMSDKVLLQLYIYNSYTITMFVVFPI